jgi:hypothetical protein
VNDSSGLIAYRYAVGAVVTGNFLLWEAGLQFVIVAGAGILVGWIVGFSFFWIHKITPHNPVVDTSLTLLTPFIAYLLAEELQVSCISGSNCRVISQLAVFSAIFSSIPVISKRSLEHSYFPFKWSDIYSDRFAVALHFRRNCPGFFFSISRIRLTHKFCCNSKPYSMGVSGNIYTKVD